MRHPVLSRRELLEKAIALGVVTTATGLGAEALAAAWEEAPRRVPPTAAVEIGPFYKRQAPSDPRLRRVGDPGLPVAISGRVLDTRGEVVPGATVEVWQANHAGHYDLDGYRYRGRFVAGPDGGYAFDSVMPGHYPGRVAQHVHYLALAPGHKPLVTQLYFATDPVFEGDPDRNYTRDPLVTSRGLVRPVTLAGDPKEIVAAVRFELVLETL